MFSCKCQDQRGVGNVPEYVHGGKASSSFLSEFKVFKGLPQC